MLTHIALEQAADVVDSHIIGGLYDDRVIDVVFGDSKIMFEKTVGMLVFLNTKQL